MDILRRTAAVWVIESSCRKLRMTVEVPDSVSPEEAQEAFQLIIHDDKKYIPVLSYHYWYLLGECVDIVNVIRKMDGCENKNIKNKYKEMFIRNNIMKAEKQLLQAKHDAIWLSIGDPSSYPPRTQTTEYLTQSQATDDQAAPQDNVNAPSAAPIAESKQPPVGLETVVEHSSSPQPQEANGKENPKSKPLPAPAS